MDNQKGQVSRVEIHNIQVVTGKGYEECCQLSAGDVVYIDRNEIAFTKVEGYEGAQYIRTAMDDAKSADPIFLTFEIDQPATVYIGYNKDALEVPQWLTRWSKLTDVIETTDKSYQMYYKEFPAGLVSLGGERPDKGPGTKTMYLVLVKPGKQPDNEARTIPVTHELRVETFGRGRVSLQPAGGVYDRGTIVTLTAQAEDGWAFAGWLGDLSGSEDRVDLPIQSYSEATAAFFEAGLPGMGAEGSKRESVVSREGIKLRPVEPGEFMMGDTAASELPEKWDEGPVHQVTITQPFYISEDLITNEQYRRFNPNYDAPDGAKYAAGISWEDANAYCEWLSEQEGVTFRLPTEAEWEYVCKAGASKPYWIDKSAIALDVSNPWGVRNLLTGSLEWCYDWYGEYTSEKQIDPVGYEHGWARVVRGGSFYGVDTFPIWPQGITYARPSNRGGYAPNFKHEDGSVNEFGRHPIGFRVVMGELPQTKPRPYEAPYVQQGVKQHTAGTKQGPNANQPYFRKRHMLPTPPENLFDLNAIKAAGFHPSIYGHNHSPGLAVCDNGDVIAAWFSAYHERTPGVNIIASRLRFGADEWDIPSPFVDFPDVNDHAPLMWNDQGKLILYWGNPKLNYVYPFQWISSEDNGASWSKVHFPHFPDPARSGVKQPINSAFRDKHGKIYMGADISGPTSGVYTSADDGRTWQDPGGSTKGRHTSFTLLRDGKTLLGMGGKGANIEGYMPQSISRDGGRTWEYSKTIFNKMDARQRPAVIQLQSGRLFMAGDFEDKTFVQAPGIHEKGCYVALSEDDGQTWIVRKLPGAQLYEGKGRVLYTLGYTAARQAPNGIIHLISTTNNPCLHFELNEAWILDEKASTRWLGLSEEKLMRSGADSMKEVTFYEETYADGNPRVRWSSGIGSDGRVLLHGNETWYYENGRKQREAGYELGVKTGTETYWNRDGSIAWTWEHRKEQLSIWTQYYVNGKRKCESHWRGMHCEGTAVYWDERGTEQLRVTFDQGKPL